VERVCPASYSEVIKILNIPESHYVATVTLIGYPVETVEPPSRRLKEEIICTFK
jgi:hypothetical protein